LKSLENEKLTLDSNAKVLKKTLLEMEEKVQKDEDRRKKIANELDSLRKNYENAKNDLDKLMTELNIVKLKKEEFQNVDKEKENLKENLVKEIR